MRDQRLYQVKERRVIFIGDPLDTATRRDGNLLASAGDFIDVDHAVLRQIISTQLGKVRPLKPGDLIPRGSVLVTRRSPKFVSAIEKYDGTAGESVERTPIDLVVGPDGDPVERTASYSR